MLLSLNELIMCRYISDKIRQPQDKHSSPKNIVSYTDGTLVYKKALQNNM